MKEFALIAPTASGKTQLAITLAKELNGAILSLDSLCVYRQINIASAKPTAAEQAQVRHFGVDVASVEEHFCAADFIRCYREAKAWCKEAGKTLIITGGSGFYLNALLTPLAPKVPPLAPFSQALAGSSCGKKWSRPTQNSRKNSAKTTRLGCKNGLKFTPLQTSRQACGCGKTPLRQSPRKCEFSTFCGKKRR